MLAFLCVVYERSHEEGEAGCGVPIQLKSALDDIALKTSRPNYLCFNDMVRLNWTLREESSSSPTAVSGTAGNLGASLVSADSAEHPQYISTRDSSRAYSFGRFNPRRIGLLLRFTATEDEDLSEAVHRDRRRSGCTRSRVRRVARRHAVARGGCRRI